MLRTSPEKATRWFDGNQFWQIPSDFVDNRTVVEAIEAELGRFRLAATSIWAAEHTYTIYNRRYESIVHLAVFAAEVGAEADNVLLGAEHSEYKWCDASEVERLIAFRGLKEGLRWVRHYVSEPDAPLPELRLA